jgi:hypothetical protein
MFASAWRAATRRSVEILTIGGVPFNSLPAAAPAGDGQRPDLASTDSLMKECGLQGKPQVERVEHDAPHQDDEGNDVARD